MMTTNRPLRVFLCHSSADKPAVRELYQKLRAEAWIDPWLDEKKLLGGQNWRKEIPKAVRSSDAVIVCLSNSSVNKEGYVQAEIKFSLDVALEKPENTIFIIPARLENCEVPNSLGDLHWVNLFVPEGYDLLISSLKVRAKSLDIKVDGSALKKTVKDNKPKQTVTPIELKPNSTVNTPAIKIEEKINPLENKAAIEAQKTEFLPHPTEEWIGANKITLSNGMEFMRIPAGAFLYGYDKKSVDISYDYWMAKFPVTNYFYDDFVASCDNIFKRNYKFISFMHLGFNWKNIMKKKSANPTNHSSEVEYCEWLSKQYKSEIPLGLTVRLPTEFEWEKAALGTDGRNYPWGVNFERNRCNTEEEERGGTTPVGLYSPIGDSPYGCSDMYGNVWEKVFGLKDDKYILYRKYDDDGVEWYARGISWSERGKDSSCRFSKLCDAQRISFHEHGFRVCIAPHIPHIPQ